MLLVIFLSCFICTLCYIYLTTFIQASHLHKSYKTYNITTNRRKKKKKTLLYFSDIALSDNELDIALEVVGTHWFPLFFNHYINIQMYTLSISPCFIFSSSLTHIHTNMKSTYRLHFTITYHRVIREVRIVPPIRVIWLSFARRRASIYISSYTVSALSVIELCHGTAL